MNDKILLTPLQYRICQTQADIFEYIATHNCDIDDFIKNYMNSDFCFYQMDTSYSRYQLHDVLECLDFICSEFSLLPQKEFINPAICYWIGFIYRGLWFKTQIPSKKLIKIISLQEMKESYIGLHTLDEDIQLNILCQRHQLSQYVYNEN
jgi:hypothetical protein